MIAYLKNLDNMLLEFHHTGCAVKSIDESIVHYRELFGPENIEKKILISSQSVYVCFIKIAPDRYLELIEPSNETSSLNRMLKKNINYYHIGYWVNNMEATIAHLESINCKHISTFNSEAFNDRKCAFMCLPDGCLIELIERA